MVGSHLTRCSECGESFTATAWLLHAHNANQARCEQQTCHEKAVGLCEVCAPLTPSGWQSIAGGLKLCGEHLLEHRRRGDTVRIVDGSVCRACEGRGEIHPPGVNPETSGGRWARCPHCQGTGYDPDLRSRTSLAPAPPEHRLTDNEDDEELARLRELARAQREQPGRRLSAETQGALRAARERREREPAQRRYAEERRPTVRRSRRFPSLTSSVLAIVSGAVVGVLFVFPLLPADVADQVIELQRRVSEMFG